ncbi:MAG: Glycosyl transferase family 2, partial [Candidatus Woesebacteria bacterium GW2011_GWA2_40_7b]
LMPIISGQADVVYGSRLVTAAPHRVLYYWHYLANKFLTSFSNVLTNLNLTDMETGFKIFRGDIVRKIAPKLQSKRFGFEPEITARISKISEIKIYEVGISYSGRTYKEGKKITWKDGVKALFEIIKYNLFTS